MPPPSPGESDTGSPPAESTGIDREGETAAGPQPKKAIGGEVGPRARRVTIGMRTGGRTERRGEPPRKGGKETGRGDPEWRSHRRAGVCVVSCPCRVFNSSE